MWYEHLARDFEGILLVRERWLQKKLHQAWFGGYMTCKAMPRRADTGKHHEVLQEGLA